MAHRSINETFRTIRPKGAIVPPNSQISASVTGTNGDLGTALSQAGQQIAQLQAAYQQQASLILANTQALQGNTSAHGGATVGGSVAGAASSLLGGGLGLLSPLISGIASLFGGGTSAPAPLPVYIPPPSVALSETLRTPGTANLFGGTTGSAPPPMYTPPAATPQGSGTDGAGATNGTGSSNTSGAQTAAPAQITVNVQAMDSQSFMDRSSDIANAVREAMLNLHPINAVVAEL
jgi:hypothetical protein